MKRISYLKVMLLIAVSGSTYAQKTKITKGDFSELKDHNEVNVVFKYDKLECVGGAPFFQEAEARSGMGC